MENVGYLIISLVVMLGFFWSLEMFMLFLIRKEANWMAILAGGTILVCLVSFSFTMGFNVKTWKDTAGGIRQQLDASIDTVVQKGRQSGASEDELKQLKQRLDAVIVRAFPAWSLISIFLIVLINYYIARLYAMKKYGIENPMPPFSFWYIDMRALWALIPALAVFAANKYINNDLLLTAAGNVIMVLFFLYLMVGMAIISYFLSSRNAPVFLRILIFVMISMMVSLWVVMAFMGVLDTWMNFRKAGKLNVTG